MKVVISTKGDFKLAPEVIDKLLVMGYPTITEKEYIGNPDSFYTKELLENTIITDVNLENASSSIREEFPNGREIFAPVRNESLLIQAIESFGVKNAGLQGHCILKIIDIPDDVDFEVTNTDIFMSEMIIEKHRTWS